MYQKTSKARKINGLRVFLSTLQIKKIQKISKLWWGSELDYSLQTIEKLLELKPNLRLQVLKQKEEKHQQKLSQYLSGQQQKQSLVEKHRRATELLKPVQKSKELKEKLLPRSHRSLKEAKVLEIFLKPQTENNAVNPHLLKRKKQKRQSQHL